MSPCGQDQPCEGCEAAQGCLFVEADLEPASSAEPMAEPMAGLMAGPASRAAELLEGFLRFHRANPEVWALFERFALEARAARHAHYSADAVMHRVRWETSVATVGAGQLPHEPEPLKVNNNHVAYYARAFCREHPDLADFFRTRRQVSADREARGGDL